jgi:hypothetical protein
MDYDGEFALWEVRAALEQAVEWITEQIWEEYGERLDEAEGDDE